jgi:hypothetical protein
MYRFCRITDLDILHFYFSSKNYSSKVYTYMEKIVVLEFAIFGFLYDFKSNLQVSAITHKGVRIFIHLGPWKF